MSRTLESPVGWDITGWVLETKVEKELQVWGTEEKSRAWGRAAQQRVGTEIRGGRLGGLDMAI